MADIKKTQVKKMFEGLAKLLVRDHKNVSAPRVRAAYGTASGILGIVCNLLLFLLKLIAGLLLGSMAVIADAFNNLSDMASTVITLLGIRLSAKKPDKSHPFGHGRLEYVSALIVAALILLVGAELLKSSVQNIITPPERQEFQWNIMLLLLPALPVKFFMFGYNRAWGKKIHSAPMLATATDSRNDCITTAAVLVSAIIDGLRFLPFSVDAYVSAAVSLLILFAGFSVGKDTVDLLLGQKPDPETVAAIKKTLLETEGILGVHDLIVHDYGPGRLFASVHAEVSDRCDIVATHEIIDACEARIGRELNCEIAIHMDPISTDNPLLEQIRQRLNELLQEEEGFSFHDLRMTDGKEHINIIFDLVIPFETTDKKHTETLSRLRSAIRELDERYMVVIQQDHPYDI